jgi:hypothetical protein
MDCVRSGCSAGEFDEGERECECDGGEEEEEEGEEGPEFMQWRKQCEAGQANPRGRMATGWQPTGHLPRVHPTAEAEQDESSMSKPAGMKVGVVNTRASQLG